MTRKASSTLWGLASGRSLRLVGAALLPVASFALQASVYQPNQALVVQFDGRFHQNSGLTNVKI